MGARDSKLQPLTYEEAVKRGTFSSSIRIIFFLILNSDATYVSVAYRFKKENNLLQSVMLMHTFLYFCFYQ